ncbi:hypothetical protein M440DRAFT_1400723 [Trichoderma longibrachiatum ATCC 18648]|uniref:Uncharacterized protein n=1 Tax=Trichoderma longibrachiatum ATCC 18648 TaxID=983965 RepID=A0A2T4C8D6_TRILO|nr:hypothetical protein M440DRAFT_1400723 [Trichoderma longibrachiatum ATCC 18648]
MFSTLVSRAAFSTSASMLKPAEATASASARSWNRLSPRTRRYVVYGVAACLAVDGYVVYKYAPWMMGLEKRTQTAVRLWRAGERVGGRLG